MLSPDEKRVLCLYSDPRSSGLGRTIRLSLQYAIGSGIFVYLCLSENEPLWVLAVYGVFLVFMLVRIRNATKIVGIMPGIIAKYETRIAELESSTGSAKSR
jgi:hypothetical protein